MALKVTPWMKMLDFSHPPVKGVVIQGGKELDVALGNASRGSTVNFAARRRIWTLLGFRLVARCARDTNPTHRRLLVWHASAKRRTYDVHQSTSCLSGLVLLIL